jgi:translation initiation factor IF-3
LNKYIYEQQKNEKEMAKKARAARIDTKEVKFKPNIGEHDLLIKLRQAQDFLDNGAKVKITIQMRGRENSNSSDVFKFFKEAIATHLVNFKYDSQLTKNGNRIIGVLFKNG